uniref:Uncharacterized protein n=1 Tax=Parascaris equorum TaxID=6256 RepID=A0A914RN83_PAREQ
MTHCTRLALALFSVQALVFPTAQWRFVCHS